MTPKAVFIIMDGIPADVIESVPTPTVDAIAGERGYTRAYVGGEIGGESESPTVSAVGYQSLITGTWANKHNVYDNDVEDPDYDYWDIFRIAKNHDPALQTAVFSTWTDNRTKLLGDGLAEAGGKKIDFAADGYELDEERFPHDAESWYIDTIDGVVAAAAATHIAESGPDLSWVYLQLTDDVGHMFGDSDEQTGRYPGNGRAHRRYLAGGARAAGTIQRGLAVRRYQRPRPRRRYRPGPRWADRAGTNDLDLDKQR